MKEFTIENKAQKYDKAFRIAQELYNDPYSSNVGKGYVCTVFPELKESEDDKVRKKLIHLVKKSHEQGGYALHKWEADEMLAWLEKQDNNKLNTNIKSCIGMILTDADEQRFKDYNTNLAVCLAWLKRQGKEKPIDWSDYDKTMAFTLMRDVDQMTCINKEAKDERIGWLNSLDEKFINYD